MPVIYDLRFAMQKRMVDGDSALSFHFVSSTFVFILDTYRSLARVTMNHLASRVRHYRLLIESFRRKQDGNLSAKLSAKLGDLSGK